MSLERSCIDKYIEISLEKLAVEITKRVGGHGKVVS